MKKFLKDYCLLPIIFTLMCVDVNAASKAAYDILKNNPPPPQYTKATIFYTLGVSAREEQYPYICGADKNVCYEDIAKYIDNYLSLGANISEITYE